MTMSEIRTNIQIKGIKDGLLVTLGEGEWSDLEAGLLKQIDDQISFFKGARLTLDVGNAILHVVEMSILRDQLSERGVGLWAVLSNSPTTESTAQNLGLATRVSTPRPDRVVRTLDTNLTSGESGILLQRTLRSGFKVSFEGHVIVLGDVNPGAEIIAGGNVIVWGKLRGSVHAGAENDDHAVVCALDLAPMNLRIGKFTASLTVKSGKPLPTVARVKNGQIVAEPWDSK